MRCRLCKNDLPIEDFGKWRTKNGYPPTICLKCKYIADIFRKFGITDHDYRRMLEAQGGGCAICGIRQPDTKDGRRAHFCVDHNHETGSVRGLLCCDCNRAIGLLKDSPAFVLSAYQYLQREFEE